MIIFFLILIISANVSEVFFTQTNLSNLTRQVAGIGLASIGMLLVIITGGIDLSVGSIAAMAGVLCAVFSSTTPLSIVLLISVASGIAVGSFSGYLVAIHKMAPFIATLAMMTIARGLGFIFSNGAPILLADEASAFIEFGSGYWLGIAYPVWIFLVISVICALLLRHHIFGRIITAIGSNEEAVRLSGIRVGIHKLSVYAISGGLAALSGLITTFRTGVGSPIVGVGMELDAIAAVVIGGASLQGGKGTAINTLLGVLILGMIGNIMNLISIPAYPQQVIKGVIIIFAVLLQKFQSKSNHN
ncbi:ABC transporter permease [Bacteroidetes bacterium endosymbiont of Geopemphigus sp.]|uniref:ABC transporter permease n=1 Tax=Bacteroidetes bacterium endosymbiont of Geopemphigus sp. TaxID=2047937 RepID=UPI001F4DDC4A|nr:ABC transporter permease [Bacteroidetes bacterium endosymbiont of Geopemphigus sp.]